MPSTAPVAIVGAGVSGLACAIHLHEAGVPVRVFEAAPEVGGRVRSERVDGFTIDRGLQVLPTAYPEVQAMLDLAALQLGRFTPGAIVQHAGRFARLVDPTRSWELSRKLASDVLPLADQLRLVSLRRHALRGSFAQPHARPEHTTLAWLRQRGFSEASIERFFRPFSAGVFLEHELGRSSRFFEFALRSFASGDATLPAEGMAAVPRQLASRLPPDAIRTRCQVEAIEAGSVVAGGTRFEAAAVVVASDGRAARRFVPALPELRHNGTVCLSFAADRDPAGERLLVLDGEGTGPVNHLCVPSGVAPSYAPAGRALVSANVIGSSSASDAELERAARAQLAGWFGAEVHDWGLAAPRARRARAPAPAGRLARAGRARVVLRRAALRVRRSPRARVAPGGLPCGTPCGRGRRERARGRATATRVVSAFGDRLRGRNPDPAGRIWLFAPYDQLSDGVGSLSREGLAELAPLRAMQPAEHELPRRPGSPLGLPRAPW